MGLNPRSLPPSLGHQETSDRGPFGVIDDTDQNTDPGYGALFSPPDGFEGNFSDYKALMRRRLRDHAWRNRILEVSRQYARPAPRDPRIRVDGRYRVPARALMREFAAWARKTGRSRGA